MKSNPRILQGLYATWKNWNLKIGQKVMEYRENLKKTWKSHGICYPVKN
jgi:hypothetical protein